jgi:hypothetical protein
VGGSPSTSLHDFRISPSPKGKERAHDVSGSSEGYDAGELRVIGKEKELLAVREAQTRRGLLDDDARTDAMQDKIKIKMLEEEIAKLREEVGLFEGQQEHPC